MIDEIPAAVVKAVWPFAAGFIVTGYAAFVAVLLIAARGGNE